MSALSAPHGQLRPPGHPRESASLCFCNQPSHYLCVSCRDVGTNEAFSSVLSHSTQTDRMLCVVEVALTSFFCSDRRDVRKFVAGLEGCLDKC